jgi:hypothetical protein
MKLLQDFREYKATATAKEDFDKMLLSKHPILNDAANPGWARWAKETAWDLLVSQDRIEQLEKKINSLMDTQNTPST